MPFSSHKAREMDKRHSKRILHRSSQRRASRPAFLILVALFGLLLTQVLSESPSSLSMTYGVKVGCRFRTCVPGVPAELGSGCG